MSENSVIVSRFVEKVLNGGQWDQLAKFCAPDFTWSAGSMGQVQGLEGYRKVLESSAASMSEMHLTLKEILTSGDDKVVIRFVNRAVNTGPYMGYPATGRQVEWGGVGIFTLIGGKISEAFFIIDTLGLLLKLGHKLPQTTV